MTSPKTSVQNLDLLLVGRLPKSLPVADSLDVALLPQLDGTPNSQWPDIHRTKAFTEEHTCELVTYKNNI